MRRNNTLMLTSTILMALAGACTKKVPLEDRPCPCATGYCCDKETNMCKPTGACRADRDGAAEGGDAVIASDGPSDRDDLVFIERDSRGDAADAVIASDGPGRREDVVPFGRDARGDAGDGPAGKRDRPPSDADGGLSSPWQPISSMRTQVGTMVGRPIMLGDRVAVPSGDTTSGIGTYDPARDTWGPLSGTGSWTGRTVWSRPVWTGSQLLSWGGVEFQGRSQCRSLGGLYSPTTDTWSAISTAGAPLMAVMGSGYTGTEVVLRGQSCIPQEDDEALVGPAIGALYNPATDAWRGMSLVNAPSAVQANIVVLGSKVVCWGGLGYLGGGNWWGENSGPATNTGSVYDTQTDTWSAMSATNAPSARTGAVSLDIGGQALIWGGTDGSRDSLGDEVFFRDGAIYDPATDTWKSMSKVGAPNVRVWTQDAFWVAEHGLAYFWAVPPIVTEPMLMWTYDVAADRWDTFDVSELPTPSRWGFVWTGRELLAIGQLGDDAHPMTVGGYRTLP